MRIFTVFNRTPRKNIYSGWTAYTLSAGDGYVRTTQWTSINNSYAGFSQSLRVCGDDRERFILGRTTPWRTARDRAK